MQFIFTHRNFLVILVTFMLSSCVTTPWENKKNPGATPEEKVAYAEEKLSQHPTKTEYKKDLLLTKDQAVRQLLNESKAALAIKSYDRAYTLYDRALKIMPDHTEAVAGKALIERELKHDQQLEKATQLAKENKTEDAKAVVHDVLLENPKKASAQRLEKDINIKAGIVKSEPPKLKPKSDKKITLELRDAKIKVVFEALSKATGINFILDKDIKPKTKATIFIKKARIRDAIEMVLSSNGLNKKVLSENTAFVFPNTKKKLQDYQDLMIRSFYLTNAKAKQVALLIKTMLKTKDVFIDERLNMVVMRDTPEVIRVAEKLVAGNDMADPEVMLEMEVLEVTRNRLQQLGINYPNRLSVVTPSALTLQSIKNLTSNEFVLTPSPSIDFQKTSGDVNLLSNPRIRVKNNEKAKILVGDKVPVITVTTTQNNSTLESVNYIDVGLTLKAQPRITLDNYVDIKVGLEVSSLGDKTQTSSGTVVYTIGTRTADTSLRLKDGETQILAGLISDDERKSASKLPALGDIPLLGRLFSNQEDQKNKTEIVLSITPRILGNIQQPDADITEHWSGTKNVISDRAKITAAPPASAQDLINEAKAARKAEVEKKRQAQENDAEALDEEFETLPLGDTLIPGESVIPNDAQLKPVDDAPAEQSPKAPQDAKKGSN